jgi:hypothetical protein
VESEAPKASTVYFGTRSTSPEATMVKPQMLMCKWLPSIPSEALHHKIIQLLLTMEVRMAVSNLSFHAVI